jgi:TolB protein
LLSVYAASGWAADTPYALSIANVTDTSGNTLAQQVQTTFRTGTQALVSQNINAEWNRLSNLIVFASNRSGNFDIWAVDPDGSSLRQLTDTPQQELEPTLNEDGTRLAFQRRAANGLWDICVAALNDDGLGVPVVVTPLEFNDYQPQFSRTPSNQLLFVSTRAGRTGLYTMNDDGSSPLEIDPDFTSGSSDPAYHPLLDGQMLFTAVSGDDRDVWRKSVSIVDGTAVNTNLTSTRLGDDYSPAWSPDASFVVFISDFGGVPNLWQAEANGDFAQQVTTFATQTSDPCISPIAGDNSCLLTLSREDGGSDLIIVSLLSGDILRNLTSQDGPGN